MTLILVFYLQLSFCKGDVITLTQTVEGGWWEGTLNDKTGWFPSNYVTDTKGMAIELYISMCLYKLCTWFITN